MDIPFPIDSMRPVVNIRVSPFLISSGPISEELASSLIELDAGISRMTFGDTIDGVPGRKNAV